MTIAVRDPDTRAWLRRAFQSLGYEVIPFSSAEDAVVRHVPKDVRLTVTASPAKGQHATIELAEKLAAHGYRVAPHLSARQIRDRAHLADIVARCRQAGIVAAFVVGGDPIGCAATSTWSCWPATCRSSPPSSWRRSTAR